MLKGTNNEEGNHSSKNQFIGDGCIDALNERIVEEEHASRLYHSMAIWFKSKGYNGFAKYWSIWANEELDHASWACDYLLDLDVKPEVRQIDKVENNFESVKDVAQKTLEAEVEITKSCNELAKRALAKPDPMLLNLASQYTKEQQEEINKITNILAKIEAFGDSKVALLEMDEQMAEGEF